MERLRFGLREAEAVFAVAEAKVEQTEYDGSLDNAVGHLLLLDKAEAHYQTVEAELKLKAAKTGEEKDAQYLAIVTRKAEARLAICEAEERFVVQPNLHFKVRKARAKLEVADARIEQMAEEVGDVREGEVQYLKVFLDKAQAGHDMVEAEFELKAASAGGEQG